MHGHKYRHVHKVTGRHTKIITKNRCGRARNSKITRSPAVEPAGTFGTDTHSQLSPCVNDLRQLPL